MKKILNILASIGLITTGTSNVVACNDSKSSIPPTPPKSESQKLYDELTSKTFTIQDNYFWGNEATYQTDLKTLLEKQAGITPKEDPNYQEDNNLIHDTNVSPLTKQGDQIVDINIDGLKKIAKVKIDWELTESQNVKGLFKFYTQYWPQYISQSNSNLISYLLGKWEEDKSGPSGKKGWWEYDKQKPLNKINWTTKVDTKYYSNKTLTELLYKNIIDDINSIHNLSSDIKSMLKIDPSRSIQNININQIYNIPKSNIYLLSNGVNYPLSFYNYYDKTKPLPKQKNWQISYDTYWHLVQNELPKTTWYIKKTSTTSASDRHNAGEIKEQLEAAQYSPITPSLTFTGNIPINGSEGQIEVYYYGIDQDIIIYVEFLN